MLQDLSTVLRTGLFWGDTLIDRLIGFSFGTGKKTMT